MKNLVVLVAFVAFAGANAVVLWDQPPHVPGVTRGDALSAFFGAPEFPSEIYDRQFMDDFRVDQPGWLVDKIVTSWVPFDTNTTVPITAMNYAFYSVTTGLVASGEATSFTRSAGPGTYFDRPEQILEMTIPVTALAPGRHYVFVQTAVNHNWYWLTSSPSTGYGNTTHFRRGPGASGTDSSWPTDWTRTLDAVFFTWYDQAFRLEGTVIPEPATLAVLGVGIAALAARRRRA